MKAEPQPWSRIAVPGAAPTPADGPAPGPLASLPPWTSAPGMAGPPSSSGATWAPGPVKALGDHVPDSHGPLEVGTMSPIVEMRKLSSTWRSGAQVTWVCREPRLLAGLPQPRLHSPFVSSLAHVLLSHQPASPSLPPSLGQNGDAKGVEGSGWHGGKPGILPGGSGCSESLLNRPSVPWLPRRPRHHPSLVQPPGCAGENTFLLLQVTPLVGLCSSCPGHQYSQAPGCGSQSSLASPPPFAPRHPGVVGSEFSGGWAAPLAGPGAQPSLPGLSAPGL